MGIFSVAYWKVKDLLEYTNLHIAFYHGELFYTRFLGNLSYCANLHLAFYNGEFFRSLLNMIVLV
jgi:hypothetical protein